MHESKDQASQSIRFCIWLSGLILLVYLVLMIILLMAFLKNRQAVVAVSLIITACLLLLNTWYQKKWLGLLKQKKAGALSDLAGLFRPQSMASWLVYHSAAGLLLALSPRFPETALTPYLLGHLAVFLLFFITEAGMVWIDRKFRLK